MEHIRKPWHLLHLIKGEENVENVNCQWCRKSVLGIPTYKCLDCELFIHKSCIEGIEVAHDLRETHHLTSTKLGKDRMEEAICSLCEKRVPHSLGENVSIIYKCIIPNCKFLTHEFCIELPFTIVLDDSHDPQRKTIPNREFLTHTFFLKPPVQYKPHCHVCAGEITGGSFLYDCSKCFCRNHSKCATRLKDKDGKCEHNYIISWKPIEFICDVCGNKSSDYGLHCSKCRLLIHTHCDRFIRNLTETGHQHPITFTLSLSQDKRNVCRACAGKVSTNYGADCCSERGCEYVFHPFCGYEIERQGGTNDCRNCPPYLVGWIGDGTKVNPKTDPSRPQHKLIWNNEQPKDKVCEGCKESILVPPFYNSEERDFYLHIRCASLPQQLNRPAIYQLPLSLHYVPSKVNFSCWECDRPCRGFCYEPPNECRPYDIQCTLIPDGFTHSLHAHQIFRGRFREHICYACGIPPDLARQFECKTCDFRVCIKCLTLPLNAGHKYDKHLLILVNT